MFRQSHPQSYKLFGMNISSWVIISTLRLQSYKLFWYNHKILGNYFQFQTSKVRSFMVLMEVKLSTCQHFNEVILCFSQIHSEFPWIAQDRFDEFCNVWTSLLQGSRLFKMSHPKLTSYHKYNFTRGKQILIPIGLTNLERTCMICEMSDDIQIWSYLFNHLSFYPFDLFISSIHMIYPDFMRLFVCTSKWFI